jgi:hypothetical protein
MNTALMKFLAAFITLSCVATVTPGAHAWGCCKAPSWVDDAGAAIGEAAGQARDGVRDGIDGSGVVVGDVATEAYEASVEVGGRVVQVTVNVGETVMDARERLEAGMQHLSGEAWKRYRDASRTIRNGRRALDQMNDEIRSVRAELERIPDALSPARIEAQIGRVGPIVRESSRLSEIDKGIPPVKWNVPLVLAGARQEVVAHVERVQSNFGFGVVAQAVRGGPGSLAYFGPDLEEKWQMSKLLAHWGSVSAKLWKDALKEIDRWDDFLDQRECDSKNTTGEKTACWERRTERLKREMTSRRSNMYREFSKMRDPTRMKIRVLKDELLKLNFSTTAEGGAR